ncbi:amino-acid N-acetyltransferase [Fodinicola acaciae]|uniref:amino-acid N-acetyltransferase n=1 Tax=Fodinicola acaciae TaxID=2681555 RepID=UPI0013D23059|nr:amino-acid N-acetyltransferase [Fodinicola acaciae]
MSTEIAVRRARTADVPRISALVEFYSDKRILLEKAIVTLYEDVQEFWVAEAAGNVVGCGALHVLWQDLGEIRTLAVDESMRGQRIGDLIMERLLRTARELGLRRLFVLTFETAFFRRHGFEEISGTPVEAEVYQQMRRSYDEGVAEFLDLEYVKPNTLGNTRMLRHL